jgi:hypothetical protein
MANTKSIDFESSSSQYAYIADASQTGLDITGDISIEAWVKIESFADNGVVAAKGNDSLNNGYRLVALSNGSFHLRVYESENGTNSYGATQAGVLSAGTWHHIAATFNSSNGKILLYLDGILDDNMATNTSNARSIYDNSDNFTIGANVSGGNKFDGLIDELRVWSDVRTPTEIADNYDKEDPAGDNLQGYWKFNDSALDETANDNDLTLVNTPTYSTDVPFSGGVSRRGGFMAFF